jgi:uncharacterized membrane protein YcaP (DUF421 family)
VEIVARTTALLLVLFVLTRVMSKRTLGDLSPFELILLVVLGDIVQQGVTQEDMSVTGAVLAISTFGFWISVLTWITWRFDRARQLIQGVPIVLVRDGRPIDEAFAVERLPIDEVMEAARQNGVEHLDDVQLAVLEANGRISIVKRPG